MSYNFERERKLKEFKAKTESKCPICDRRFCLYFYTQTDHFTHASLKKPKGIIKPKMIKVLKLSTFVESSPEKTNGVHMVSDVSPTSSEGGNGFDMASDLLPKTSEKTNGLRIVSDISSTSLKFSKRPTVKANHSMKMFGLHKVERVIPLSFRERENAAKDSFMKKMKIVSSNVEWPVYNPKDYENDDDDVDDVDSFNVVSTDSDDCSLSGNKSSSSLMSQSGSYDTFVATINGNSEGATSPAGDSKDEDWPVCKSEEESVPMWKSVDKDVLVRNIDFPVESEWKINGKDVPVCRNEAPSTWLINGVSEEIIASLPPYEKWLTELCLGSERPYDGPYENPTDYMFLPYFHPLYRIGEGFGCMPERKRK